MASDTIEDIVAWIRCHVSIYGYDLADLAARLEAAWKREKAEIEANALAAGGIVEASRHKQGNAASEASTQKSENCVVGNAAAMREALADIADICDGKKGQITSEERLIIYNLAKTARALPFRNCDVGTAEEQAERFYNFCVRNSGSINGMCDPKCPCIASPDKCHCMCKWAQMPYEADAEEGGAK